VLSRLKPTAIEDHPLPGPKGRGAILVRFGEGPEALVVVMMHLALGGRTRNLQLAYVRELIGNYKHQVLMGDFELTCADGQVVNVAQLLDNSHRWHNTRFADPLDPDTDRRVAVARLLNGTRPDLFSHRHGGMRYELRRQSARVQLGRGMRVDATDALLHVLRDRSELFDFGTNAIAFVADGKATPVSRDWPVDHGCTQPKRAGL
jgi:hypothetical protein